MSESCFQQLWRSRVRCRTSKNTRTGLNVVRCTEKRSSIWGRQLYKWKTIHKIQRSIQVCLLLFIRPSKTCGKSVNLLTDDCCISGHPKLKLHSDPILISNLTCQRKVIFWTRDSTFFSHACLHRCLSSRLWSSCWRLLRVYPPRPANVQECVTATAQSSKLHALART